MTEPIELTIDARPRLLPLYGIGLMRYRRGLPAGQRLPKARATWQGARADPGDLERYRAACGLPPSALLPPLFPLALAFPIQMQLITHSRFPLSYVRMLHLNTWEYGRIYGDLGRAS